MKFIVIVMVMVALVSCTKQEVKTNAADLVATNLSTAISTGLECAKPEVVAADVKVKVYDLFKIQAQGNIVAATFCKTVVDIVIPQVINVALPKTWECKATNVDAKVTDLLKTKACEKL